MSDRGKQTLALRRMLSGDLSRRDFAVRSAVAGLSLPAMTALGANDLFAAVATRTDVSFEDEARLAYQEKPTVRLAQGAAVQYLDPNLNLSGIQQQVHKLTHNTLIDFDAELNIVPSLAESWEIVDPTTYVFNLRQGVLFHDGTELKATDVKFTLERCNVNPDTLLVTTASSCNAKEYLDEIQALDDYTLQLNLIEPFAPILGLLTYSWRIVPADLVMSLGAEEYNKQAIGTGPFKITAWDTASGQVDLEAFEEYFEGPPAIGKVVIRAIPEDATRVSALRSGEVDIITNVPAESISLIEDSEGLKVESADGNRFVFVIMNNKIPPFDNVLVRRAVSHAIDWNTIIATVLGGQATYMPVPITPFDFPYDGLVDLAETLGYAYDPDQARALLTEAGHPDGFSVDFEGPIARTPKDVEVLTAIAGYLQAIGINATPKPQEFGYYNAERFLTGKIACGLGSMANPIADFDWIFAVHLDPNRRSLFYSEPELTEMAQNGLRTPDSEERTEIYRDAMAYIMEDAAFAFGYILKNVYGLSDKIVWTPRPGEEVVLLDEASVSS